MNIQNAGGVDALCALFRKYQNAELAYRYAETPNYVAMTKQDRDEAEATLLAALSAVSPDAATVDDAMVEAFKTAFHGKKARALEYDDALKFAMTEALQAARVPDGETDERECCPVCRSADRITFRLVPDHRREWTDDKTGEEFTEYMPPMRDCKCANCDSQWILPESQDDFR